MILPGISLLDADYVVVFIRLIKSEIEKGCLILFSTKCYTDILWTKITVKTQIGCTAESKNLKWFKKDIM